MPQLNNNLVLEVGEVYETNEHDTVKVIYLLEGQPIVLSWIVTAPESCWGKPHFIEKSHIIKQLSKSRQKPGGELTEREAKLGLHIKHLIQIAEPLSQQQDKWLKDAMATLKELGE